MFADKYVKTELFARPALTREIPSRQNYSQSVRRGIQKPSLENIALGLTANTWAIWGLGWHSLAEWDRWTPAIDTWETAITKHGPEDQNKYQYCEVIKNKDAKKGLCCLRDESLEKVEECNYLWTVVVLNTPTTREKSGEEQVWIRNLSESTQK